MSQPKLSAERMLKLRLAARALVEWKEPPTSPRYKRVVKELLAVHPFAAQAGFSPDSPAFELDTRGVALWYLSETLDDVHAGWSPPRLEYGGERERRMRWLADFRENQFLELINELQDLNYQSLGHGLSVISVLAFIYRMVKRAGRMGIEQEPVNRALVAMLGKSKEVKLGLLKGLTKVIADFGSGLEGRWAFRLFRVVTKTPFAFALVLALLSAVIIIVTRLLLLPRWVEVAMATSFLALLAESLTTKKIYYALKNSSLDFRIFEWGLSTSDVPRARDDGLRIYARHLGRRCLSEEGLLPFLLKENVGGIPHELWWLLPYYPAEGVESALGLLADREISARGRAGLFAWLCRVRIAPREDLFASRIRSYLEVYWPSMGVTHWTPPPTRGVPEED